MEWKISNDDSIDPTTLEAIKKIQKFFDNKISSPLISYKEKIESLCNLTDKEIEDQRPALIDCLKGKGLFDSLPQSRALISHLNWLLQGNSRISYDVGAINRVLKEYARTTTDQRKKELINAINFSLILLDLRADSSSFQKSNIWECIFSYFLARRLNEKICDDEYDFFEFLKYQILQDIIAPIKSICEKITRLIKNPTNKKDKFPHLSNIYTILEFFLKNNVLSKDGDLYCFNESFFILSIFISEARNMIVHIGSEHFKINEEPQEWIEENTMEKVRGYTDLIIELELKKTIEERLLEIKNQIKVKDKLIFPYLANEIENLLQAYDLTFHKDVSIEKEGFNGCLMEKRWAVPRNKKTKIIQVEASKLLSSLHSYMWDIIFFFCLHLDNKMLANNR